MPQLIGFFFSDYAVLLMLLAAFALVSYWSIGDNSGYQPYATGIGIATIVVIFVALFGGPPYPPIYMTFIPTELTLLDVFLPLLLSIFITLFFLLTQLIWSSEDLRRVHEVLANSFLFTLLVLLMFVVDTPMRRRIGYFAATSFIILLVIQLARRYIGELDSGDFSWRLLRTPRYTPPPTPTAPPPVSAQSTQSELYSAGRPAAPNTINQIRNNRQRRN